jgi:hypothetical protein
MESSFLGGYAPSFVLFLAAIFLLGWQKLQVKNVPQEPPLLKPKIPIIGHLIGLLRYRMEYYHQLAYGLVISSNLSLLTFGQPGQARPAYLHTAYGIRKNLHHRLSAAHPAGHEKKVAEL